MKDPKEIMSALLWHLKNSETQINAALDLFHQLPRRGKSVNAAKRMDQLFRAITILKNCQSNLPSDWQKSGWFRAEEHESFLRDLEKQIAEQRVAP
jgi:hypothetical protein